MSSVTNLRSPPPPPYPTSPSPTNHLAANPPAGARRRWARSGSGADAAVVAEGRGDAFDAPDPFVERVGHEEVAGLVELQRPRGGEPGRRGRPAVAAVVVRRGVAGLPVAGHGADDAVGVDLADPLVE